MTPQRLFDFLPLAVQSLTQPRVGLRTILAIPTQRVDVINAAWLVIVLNLIISAAFTVFGPTPTGPEQAVVPITTSAIMLAMTMFGGGILVYVVGKKFGGTGSFDDSMKMVVWVNFILLLMQIPVPFAAAMGPEITGLVLILVVIVAMVQMTAQVMELHGFSQVFPVILGIIGTQFAFGIVLLIVLGLLGVSVPIEPAN